MVRPCSAFVRIPKTLWLVFIGFCLFLAVALVLNVDAWSQTKQSAPAQKKTQAAPAKVTPAKAPNWCLHAAPVSGGVATIRISPSGPTPTPPALPDLKVDYDRACISPTDTIKWEWSGGTEPAWSVDFSTGANPFRPKNKFNHGNPNSGRPSASANPHLIYKYTIRAPGYNDLDPDVIIRGSS